MTEYDKFIEAVYAGVEFDENAEADDLRRLADRFEALRKTWVAGERYEPSGALHDLVCVFFGTFAKRYSSDLCLEVERAFDLLSQFCTDLARAREQRKRGTIETALQYEQVAERAYRQLPEAWRW